MGRSIHHHFCLAVALTFFFQSFPLHAEQSISLEKLIDLAAQTSDWIQVTEKSIQSAESDIASRELELSPLLSSEFSRTADSRATFSPGRRATSYLLETSLSKLFPTGTTLAFYPGYEFAEVASVSGVRHIADWELVLSQSLLRNGFGKATRLRRKSDNAELQRRRLEALHLQQQFLIDLEAIYWDLALAHKEEEINKENLKRSVELEKWIRDRIRRSAAERTDLLQIEALVSRRRLELSEIQNRIQASQNRLRQLLPSLSSSPLTPDLKSLETTRPLNELLLVRSNKSQTSQLPIRLDALASHYRSSQSEFEALRVKDSTQPALSAFIAHGRNGIEPRFGEAWSQAFGPESDSTRIGLSLTLELDRGLIRKQREAARFEAESEALLAEFRKRESQVGWQEIERQIQNLSQQTTEARTLATLQLKKSNEERKRLQLGRTTSFQAITFEVEAAEAQLQLYRLLTVQRKTEALARSFTRSQEITL